MFGRARYLTIFVSMLAALPLMRAASAADIGVSEKEIKIGVHTSLTGGASFIGQGGRLGIDLATAEINAHGGVNGRKLNVVYVDDRGAPDGGVSAARRLVDEEKVFAVFGAGPSAATVSVLPFFQQTKVPYFVSFASDPRVLEKFSANIYSGATVPQADALGEYAKFLIETIKAKRVAIFACDQPHCSSGKPILKGLLDKAGVASTIIDYNSGDTDFTGQIQQAIASKPDAVFLFGLAPDEGRLIPQIRNADIQQPIVTDTSGCDLSVLRLSGKAAEGYYTFWFGGSQFYDDNTGAMGKFYASLDANKIQRPANTPNLYSLMAYSDVYVVAEAIRLAGPDPTRAGLLKALDTGINGFVGGKTEPWTFAAPIGIPRTFTATDHKGTSSVVPVVVRNGSFKPVS